ncbi:hypothetical protein MKX01_016640 [Papaver californicum]|nr:hypothetical protein MKX01_016640 [Papaver californicum]
MAKIWLVSSYFLLFLLFSFSTGTMKLTNASTLSSIFIFGDSEADVGTNNYSEPDFVARENYRHNGIDFSSTGLPTRSFVKGRNTADYLDMSLVVPTFHALLNKQGCLKRHVIGSSNFSSRGFGILLGTGSQFVKTLSSTLICTDCTVCYGSRKSYRKLRIFRKNDTFISKSLFFVSVGSNDIFEYYFLSNKNPNTEEFMTGLKSTYVQGSTKRFKNITVACCGGGKFNRDSPCIEAAEVCWNRSEYLFWDWYHPTQASADLAVVTLYGGPPRFVTPINFRQLAGH